MESRNSLTQKKIDAILKRIVGLPNGLVDDYPDIKEMIEAVISDLDDTANIDLHLQRLREKLPRCLLVEIFVYIRAMNAIVAALHEDFQKLKEELTVYDNPIVQLLLREAEYSKSTLPNNVFQEIQNKSDLLQFSISLENSLTILTMESKVTAAKLLKTYELLEELVALHEAQHKEGLLYNGGRAASVTGPTKIWQNENKKTDSAAKQNADYNIPNFNRI